MNKLMALVGMLGVSLFVGVSSVSAADVGPSQTIYLEPGWNIASTPMVLESHEFSVSEDSTNFDIYVLDASEASGWATMADLGQTEFTPLYGYFINNKTTEGQTMTLNYKVVVSPAEKLFGREFTAPGWYSIGVANDEYAKDQVSDTSDTNNPSRVLSLLAGKYDLAIDFTNSVYLQNRRSVALDDPWKAVVPADINSLNDLRETKGYAIYIKEAGALYNGFQNDPPLIPVVNGPEELIIRTSLNDVDSRLIALENDSKSDFETVFVFALDSDDSDDNIEILSIPVQVNLGGAAYNAVIDDAQLEIGGVMYDSYTVSDVVSSNPTLTFTNTSGTVIFPGEQIDVTLRLRFKALAPENEGVTVRAAVNNSSPIVAEGLEVLTAEQIMGSATGDTHTLRTQGVYVTLDSDSAVVTTGDNAGDDYATFRLVLEVTAFEQDVYISTNQTTSIMAAIVDGAGASVGGTSTIVIDSSADVEGGSFKIAEGETETVNITATFDAATAGAAARLQLNSLVFGQVDGANNQTLLALPATDYRTDIVTLVN